MTITDPDPAWYLDHVVVPAGEGLAPMGPIRSHFAEWDAVVRGLDAVRGSPLARVRSLARRQGLVVTRGQVRACGVTDADVRSLIRRRVWTVPRRGVICPVPAAGLPDHEVILPATAAALVRPGTAISMRSAAAVHAIPLLRRARVPTLSFPPGSMACARDDVRVHATGLAPADVETWFGAPITTPARTALDLARADGVAAGLVAADALLHEHVVAPSDLRRALRRQRGWPGVRAARRVVDLADGRSESVLETLTRLVVLDAGLPAPELQVWIDASDRRYRVDLAWPEHRVIVEADGMLKYRNDPQALMAEKRRHEYLARAGWIVIRVMWDDVVHAPRQTAARIAAALGLTIAS